MHLIVAVVNASRFAHWIPRSLTTFGIYFRLLSEHTATRVAHEGKSCVHQTRYGKEESRRIANAAIPGISINLHFVEVLYVTKPLSKLHGTLGKKRGRATLSREH